jgi:undecaprenyl-phosphate 4-deoxy-4-formamido-L-arabinose transferase
MTKSISIVIPVYNSAELFPLVVSEINQVLSGSDRPYEIILVNDGSRDGSWQGIENLVSKKPGVVRGINLMKNYGQHNALLCGIRAAKHEICVTMDDDGQHAATDIPKLLAKLDEGFEVVYGAPLEQKHGLLRDIASVLTKAALQNIMNAESARNVSAFRMFYTRLREAFVDVRGATISIDVLLTWGSTKFGVLKVAHRPRIQGESQYSFRRLFQHAMNMMTGYSTLPLRISSGIGFILTLFGAVVFMYTFIRYLIFGGVVPGFTFLASMISVFSGAQLFALGIMGEYLGRMHYRLMDKPSYTIAEKQGFNE